MQTQVGKIRITTHSLFHTEDTKKIFTTTRPPSPRNEKTWHTSGKTREPIQPPTVTTSWKHYKQNKEQPMLTPRLHTQEKFNNEAVQTTTTATFPTQSIPEQPQTEPRDNTDYRQDPHANENADFSVGDSNIDDDMNEYTIVHKHTL